MIGSGPSHSARSNQGGSPAVSPRKGMNTQTKEARPGQPPPERSLHHSSSTSSRAVMTGGRWWSVCGWLGEGEGGKSAMWGRQRAPKQTLLRGRQGALHPGRPEERESGPRAAMGLGFSGPRAATGLGFSGPRAALGLGFGSPRAAMRTAAAAASPAAARGARLPPPTSCALWAQRRAPPPLPPPAPHSHGRRPITGEEPQVAGWLAVL